MWILWNDRACVDGDDLLVSRVWVVVEVQGSVSGLHIRGSGSKC